MPWQPFGMQHHCGSRLEKFETVSKGRMFRAFVFVRIMSWADVPPGFSLGLASS